MATPRKIAPCLWFDSVAEEAAKFYTGLFDRSRILSVTRYGEAGHEVHGRPAGSVMTVEFELNGQPFTALNGGPLFKFNAAISLQVFCTSQSELDRYWAALTAGGDPKAQQCGWLKDKFGVSWQIVPSNQGQILAASTPEERDRIMTALLKMKKLDLAALERARSGETQ
jgi:predicted 3-demethylubiquinone-9 3-methyltransferase (glyoxalase superfamily)